MIEVRTGFGCNDYFVSTTLESLPEKLLAVAMSVSVRCVEEVAAEIKCFVDRGERGVVVGWSIAVSEAVSSNRPSAETDFAYS